MDNITQKKCSRCGAIKNIVDFNVDRHLKGGIKSECRDCQKDANRHFRETNPDKIKAYSKKFYDANREALLEKNRVWQKNNQESVKRRGAKYKHSNPNHWKRWVENNPEKVKEINRVAKARRRAQQRESSGCGVTRNEWEQIKKDYGGRCAYCNQKSQLQMDHIVPLASGGVHEISNIVPACGKCNNHKRSTPMIVFLLRKLREYLI